MVFLNIPCNFYTQCRKTSAEEEAQQLLWRVQAIANHNLPQPDMEQAKGCPPRPDALPKYASRPLPLSIRMSRPGQMINQGRSLLIVE